MNSDIVRKFFSSPLLGPDYFDRCAELGAVDLVTMETEGQPEGFGIPRLRPEVATAWLEDT